ncbi:hypothetical protein WN943_001429 [Citrus x changshan-huyou]
MKNEGHKHKTEEINNYNSPPNTNICGELVMFVELESDEVEWKTVSRLCNTKLLLLTVNGEYSGLAIAVYEGDNVQIKRWQKYPSGPDPDRTRALQAGYYPARRLLSYFHEGLTSQGRQVVEMMCNGEFRDKSPEDALDYLDYIAENAQQLVLMSHQVNLSHLHLEEARITLEKTMFFKQNLHP